MIRPRISILLLIVLYNILLVHGQSNSDCSYNTQTVILEIQLDENTSETGYALICDDEIIWNVPVGSLSDRPAGTWIVEQSCVDRNVTVCDFTIEDSGNDGFTGGEYGFFTLVFDATTVAFSEYGRLEPFTKRSYCFGTDCVIRPVEEKEDSDVASEWVVHVATIMPNFTISSDDESNDEKNDSGNWVVNVTIFEDDKDDQKNDDESTKTNITTTENNDSDDKKNTDNVNETPSNNNQTSNRIDNTSSSKSTSVVLIVSIVVCMLIGVITIGWFLFLRWKNGQDKDKPLPLNSNTRVKQDEIDDDDEDDHKRKTVIENVQYSETMITYDSSENTIVRTV